MEIFHTVGTKISDQAGLNKIYDINVNIPHFDKDYITQKE